MSQEETNQATRSQELYDMIHLENEDEICLHALSILQADHLSCYLPILPTDDPKSYLIGSDHCVPVMHLSFRDKFYVSRHIRKLLTDFLMNVISSMDYAMSPQCILFAQDQLYFHRKEKKLVCVYLPLRTSIRGHQARLSGVEEASLDELFRYPLENKWIPSQSLEQLYRFFREDDEDGARFFLTHTIWKRKSSLTSSQRKSLLGWIILLVFYTLFSPYTSRLFRGTLMADIPDLLVLISTLVLVSLFLLSGRKSAKERRHHDQAKSQRRKSRNAQILFPDKAMEIDEDSKYAFSDDPVQFTDVSVAPVSEREQSFTIWTKGFTVGLDCDCCDMAIDHASISLKHAFFGTDEYGFYIEDLKSRHGSFVNRKRIEPFEKNYLSDGDIVGIGKKEFVVHFIREKAEDHLLN